MSYKQERADFETLKAIKELYDEAGLDGERETLMENPTKKFAAELYNSACMMWFQENGVLSGTEKIAKRHGL